MVPERCDVDQDHGDVIPDRDRCEIDLDQFFIMLWILNIWMRNVIWILITIMWIQIIVIRIRIIVSLCDGSCDMVPVRYDVDRNHCNVKPDHALWCGSRFCIYTKQFYVMSCNPDKNQTVRRNKFRIPAQCVPDFATLDLIACHLKLHLCLYVACLFIRQAGIYNLIFHVFLYTE